MVYTCKLFLNCCPLLTGYRDHEVNIITKCYKNKYMQSSNEGMDEGQV